jgi:predicted transcriptional regulator
VPRQKSNAELMRLWRRLMDFNTERAGKELGLSPRAIEDIEQGRRRADDMLTRIALDALVHDAAHDRDCRLAATAILREKKSAKGS